MMRRVFFFPLSAGSAAMSLLFAGCVESGPRAPPPPALDPFCATLAEPFCEAMYACCVEGTYLKDLRAGVTVDECKENWSHGVCFDPYLKRALETLLESGSTVFNQAKLDACVAHLKPLSPGGDACVAPPQEILVAECFSAFEGQVSPGDRCTWELDGLVHGLTSFVECEDGLCVNGECVPFLKTGDACPTGDRPGVVPFDQTCNFAHLQWCKGPGDTGTCGPRDEIGEACNPNTLDQFRAFECRSLYCDRTTRTCRATGSPTDDGTACAPF